MDCKGKYEQLPQVDVRVKAWTPIFLPNPWLKVEADLKIVFNIKSVAAAIGQTTEAEPIDDDHVHSVAVQFDMDMLTIIPKPIRDMLVHETWYTLTYARRLLVFSRDLAQNRKPNRNLKAGCCLKCNACRAMESHHKCRLTDLCRVCGCKLQRGVKAKGKPPKPEPTYQCSAYTDSLLVAFDISVYQEEIHPQLFCTLCHKAMLRVQWQSSPLTVMRITQPRAAVSQLSKRSRKRRVNEMSSTRAVLSAESSTVISETELKSLDRKEKEHLLKSAGITKGMTPDLGAGTQG
ncbi:hypothetical protein EMCRGX_G032910 [Ephydatia muelleri]